MEMNERGKDVDELVDADVVDIAELLLQAAVLVIRECRAVEVEAREMLEAVALLILEFVERTLARVRLEERLDDELRTRVWDQVEEMHRRRYIQLPSSNCECPRFTLSFRTYLHSYAVNYFQADKQNFQFNNIILLKSGKSHIVKKFESSS